MKRLGKRLRHDEGCDGWKVLGLILLGMAIMAGIVWTFGR